MNNITDIEHRVFILYGPPGSGKSTLATVLKSLSKNKMVILCNDKIRKNLKYPYDESKYTPFVYNKLADYASYFLEKEYDVILDATFYKKSYRDIVFKHLAKANYKWVIIKLTTPIQICEKRIQLRNSYYNGPSFNSIDRFHKLINNTEKMLEDEYPLNAINICIDTKGNIPIINDMHYDSFNEFINQLLELVKE